MTLNQILTAVATYHQKTVADLTINSQNLGLVALNVARQAAVQRFDFEFTRQLVDVAVNGVTGGNLALAEIYGTSTVVEVGTILDVGLFDSDGNLRPVEWTTVGEGLERQRLDNAYDSSRYQTEDWYQQTPAGIPRFQFAGDKVYAFPKDSENNYTLGLECYTNPTDWVSGNLDTEFAPWTTKGAEFFIWKCVDFLNPHFISFVSRTEGNLSERDIQAKAEAALQAFREWDLMRFEQLRRHGR